MITRKNLTAGQQITQTSHAVADFMAIHPDIASTWWKTSNTMVCLEVENEEKLRDLAHAAEMKNIASTLFVEPDLADQATALCLAPGEATRKLTANLSLAGKPAKLVNA